MAESGKQTEEEKQKKAQERLEKAKKNAELRAKHEEQRKQQEEERHRKAKEEEEKKAQEEASRKLKEQEELSGKREKIRLNFFSALEEAFQSALDPPYPLTRVTDLMFRKDRESKEIDEDLISKMKTPDLTAQEIETALFEASGSKMDKDYLRVLLPVQFLLLLIFSAISHACLQPS